MKTIFTLIASAVISLTLIIPALAQQNIKEQKQDLRQNIREEKQDVRQNIKEERQAAKEQIKQFKQDEIQKFKNEREKAKEAVETKKAEFKQAVEAKRLEAKQRIETKRQELKQNLTKIKDERKKQAAEKIYNNLNELNERMMKHFVGVLDHLENVLGKIKDRTAKAEANNKDVSAVKIAISSAEQIIANSRTVVETQSKKAYDFTFNSEETLRLNAGKAKQTLHTDIEAIKNMVFDAREAVRKAAVALAQIPRVDELEVSTALTPAAATPAETPSE